jgi:peptidyl-prolyl cis-trans isomerase SurA
MTSSMKHLRFVTGQAARGALPWPRPGGGRPALDGSPGSPRPIGGQPAAPPPAPPPPRALSESVAAVVNDEIISTYDLEQRMRLLIATSGVQPTQETLPQFQREALISLVDERLQLQELHHQSRRSRRSASSPRRRGEGRAVGTRAGQQHEGRGLRERPAKPGDRRRDPDAAAARPDQLAALDQRPLRLAPAGRRRPDQGHPGASRRHRLQAAVSGQRGLIDASRVGGQDAAVKGAQQLVTQMQQGAPFPAVARQFSAAPTAANGGDAGWISPGEMPPEVDLALEQLRPGQLSQPIPVKDGVYIVYLREKRSGAGGMLVNLKQAAVALPQGASAGDEEAARAKLEAVPQPGQGLRRHRGHGRPRPGRGGGRSRRGRAQRPRAAVPATPPRACRWASCPPRSAPNAGLHLLAVCGKRPSGGAEMNRAQIERRLFSQQLSMIARRYMRDLRNSATIETR